MFKKYKCMKSSTSSSTVVPSSQQAFLTNGIMNSTNLTNNSNMIGVNCINKNSSTFSVHSNNNSSSNNKNYVPSSNQCLNSNNNHNEENNQRSHLRFHCQLAHGSPTVFVSGFSNVRELYQKIAEGFDFPATEILFCTLNTYKTDMKKLLGGQIGLEDFIFIHKKGRPKEIEVEKTEDALGLTITDNGAGYAFIKRIKEGSTIDKIPHIQVGDHIERLNGEQMVGKRHFEVARLLKDIPKGGNFTIRLIEPMRSGFTSIGPKTSLSSTNRPAIGPPAAIISNGRETLRFKASGGPVIGQRDDVMDSGVDKINGILENFLGINDTELASHIWEISVGKMNSMDFAEAIDNSDLDVFGFTDELVIELWGVITDARDGR